MPYTHHKVSDNAIGAGYPGRPGCYVIEDDSGKEIATCSPEIVEKLTAALNATPDLAARKYRVLCEWARIVMANDPHIAPPVLNDFVAPGCEQFPDLV